MKTQQIYSSLILHVIQAFELFSLSFSSSDQWQSILIASISFCGNKICSLSYAKLHSYILTITASIVSVMAMLSVCASTLRYIFNGIGWNCVWARIIRVFDTSRKESKGIVVIRKVLKNYMLNCRHLFWQFIMMERLGADQMGSNQTRLKRLSD